MPLDLPSLGWDGHFRALYRPYERPDLWPGRVSWVDCGICSVLGEAGAALVSTGGALLVQSARDPSRAPCPGDWVVVQRWPDDRVTVEAVLRRRTAIVRGGAAPGPVLVANVDTVAIAAPVDPEPDRALIERLLAIARAPGVRPIVLLTQADRERSAAAVAAAIGAAVPGVDVWPVSSVDGTGLARVRATVPPGTTLALLGPPGSGKSSLVNALVGAAVMAVPRRRRGPSRPTVAFQTLIPLPGGGVVLDTPGISAAELGAGGPAGAAGSGPGGR